MKEGMDMAGLAVRYCCNETLFAILRAGRRLGVRVALLVAACATGAAAGDGPHDSKGRRANRLIDSSSPYLLQHAYNPVNWFPWGDEAFELAKRDEKPIFLSIGYAACHWCHVMERESFENEKTAEVLNEHFICIKVDREERPDIDEIYMAATTAATGRGGWPMSIFMTPDRKPFLCGTYFPPVSRGRRRGFRELCEEIAEKWQADRDLLLDDAGALVTKVRNIKRTDSGTKLLDRRTVSRNIARKAARFDPVLGGYKSGRNKFPPTMVMELMLREQASQPPGLNATLLAPVETTLTRMANGGIFDQIGGGICRYSTDPRWFAPHFEKMLYDQARVVGVYLSAYQMTHKSDYARVARSILDYCLTDLRDPKGGFYSSRDADSEGQEGKFYTWRRDELERILGPDDLPLFCDYYNVRPGGNWHHGQNILHVTVTDAEFAAKHKLDVDVWRKRLDAMRSIVFDVRSKRVAPGLDDKILTEWNGLLITQLARAYRILDEPRYRDAAVDAADFILDVMVRDGRLYRAHRKGVTHIRGYASDYANIVEALITLYETTFERKWLAAAEQLNDTFIKHFHDRTGGAFFYTAQDAEQLLTRSKNTRDSVVPSGNSTATLNLLRLAILLDRSDLRELAEQTIRTLQPLLVRGALERMQWAVLFYHDQPREIAIVGEPEDIATKALVAEVYRNYLPNKVVTMCRPTEAAAENALPLLRRKKLINGQPAAYVCRDYMCRRPVTKPDDLAKQLRTRR